MPCSPSFLLEAEVSSAGRHHLLIPGGVVVSLAATLNQHSLGLSFALAGNQSSDVVPEWAASDPLPESLYPHSIALPIEGVFDDWSQIEFQEPFYLSHHEVILPIRIDVTSRNGLYAFVIFSSSTQPTLLNVVTINTPTSNNLTLVSEQLMDLWSRSYWTQLTGVTKSLPNAMHNGSDFATLPTTEIFHFVIVLKATGQHTGIIAFQMEEKDDNHSIDICEGFCPRSVTWMYRKRLVWPRAPRRVLTGTSSVIILTYA